MNNINMIEYNGVFLPINKDWQRIGISLSGGADSALLAFLICSNIDAEIHIITQIRCWKTRPWQRENSLDVYRWLKNRFKNIFIRHEGFIPPDLEWGDVGPNLIDEYGKLKSGNQIILRSHNEYICHRYNLNAWFAAVNKNPPFHIDGSLDDRNEGHIPSFINHMGVDVCHPFITTEKNWIIKQYRKNNILDLLDLTRSCEGDNIAYPEIFGDLDYRTYKPGQYVPICGKCFWCQERNWALRCE